MAFLDTTIDEEFVVGKSPPMQEVYRQMQAAAGGAGNVLITGESGTGKELVARYIHWHSRRISGPFVPVNCGAIPKELFESELFGHVKGAFTGAVSEAVGLFRAADGGTIFLDEVTEIPSEVQVKLLRVLQDKRIRPLGKTEEMPVDVRVIAATNQDLGEALGHRVLRKDFYYRLGVITIHIPPLRDRAEDIPDLVAHFLNRLNRRFGRKVEGVAQAAMDMFANYDWPGNVRQLENVIENAFLLSAGERIQEVDLEQHEQIVTPIPPSQKTVITSIDERWFLPTLSSTLSGRIRAAARSTAGVLLFGEEGTGSRLVARAIHHQSQVANGPFVVVYCNAIAAEDMGRELFGEAESEVRRKGYVQQAEGGTLYLREITALPRRFQLILASFLDQGIYHPQHVDETLASFWKGAFFRSRSIRIIGYTAQDVDEALASGALAVQLYARLSAFSIHLPSLRGQQAQLPGFIDHYLEVFSRRLGRARPEVDEAAMACLTAYPWPGNVIEMTFVLQGALLAADCGTIRKDHLPDRVRLYRPRGPQDAGPGTLREMEQALVREALQEAGGNKARAAQMLGISRNRLYRILRVV